MHADTTALDDLDARIPETVEQCVASPDGAARHCAEQWFAHCGDAAPETWVWFRAGYIAGRQPFDLPASVDFFKRNTQ